MADIATSLLLLLAVGVGFGLARLSCPRRPRRAANELHHRPDPTTQFDLSLDTDECDAWLEEVTMPPVHRPDIHPIDVTLRAAGFSIWSRPKVGEPRWQDRWPARDIYPQSVALRIASDRLMVEMRGRD